MAYYGVNEMREEERKEFLVCYESQRYETFNNRHVLFVMSSDVTVLMQACRLV